MKTFTDAKGIVWTLKLTLSAMQRVEASAGINLSQLFTVRDGEPDLEGSVVLRLGLDVGFLIRALYAAVEAGRPPGGLTLDEFEERLEGPGILDAARTAFLEEWGDFFQRKGQTTLQKALHEMASGLTNLDGSSGRGSTESPASSASTPPA